MIDAPHHRGGFLIRQKAIFVRRVDAVAIGGLPTQKFAFFLQRAFCPQHLGTAILGIQLVEQKFEHAGIQTIPAHFFGVIAVVHRNVAHTQPLKGLLHQCERLAAVAPQPGKVGGGKAANAAAFQLSHQPLKSGALKVGAGITVVLKLRHYPESVFLRPPVQIGALIGNGSAFRPLPVRRA